MNAGSVNVTGSTLETKTSGDGDAGSIAITVSHDGAFAISDSSINTSTSGQGQAGKIDVSAGSVDITDDSSIETKTSGAGNAGNIIVNVNDSVNGLQTVKS